MNVQAPGNDGADVALGDVAATQLSELMGWHGAAFVRCAYRTLLARPVDEQGLRYYAGRLSEGHSRLSVLRQISQSNEARRGHTALPGLVVALQRHRRAHWPVIGSLFPLAPGEEGDSAGERAARAQALRAEAAQRQLQRQSEASLDALRQQVLAVETDLGAVRAYADTRDAQLRALITDLERFLEDTVRQQVAAHHQLRQRADMARDAIGELRLQALDDRARLGALEQLLALLQRDLHDGVMPSDGMDSAELAALRALPASARALHARLRRLRGDGAD